MVSDYRRIQSSTGTGDLVFNWTHGGIREGCTRSLPSSDGASRDALQRVADRRAMRLRSISLWLLATMRLSSAPPIEGLAESSLAVAWNVGIVLRWFP